MIRIITKLYMIERDISFQSLHRNRMFHNLVLFFFSKEFKYSLGSCRRRLQHIRDLRYLLDRLGKRTHILNEGLDITHFNCFADCQISSKDRNTDVSQIADKLHDRHHHTGKEL